MTDRIANPWGERTPFGPGEEWPVRVDQFPEDGVSEDEVDSWVQTASLHHANGDALDLAVKGNRIVGVRGRAVDRVNRGRLDPKDLFVWQAYNSPDRLTRPLVRDNGELVEANWEEAMGLLVERSEQLLEEKGPLAFGFYTSGQLFLDRLDGGLPGGAQSVVVFAVLRLWEIHAKVRSTTTPLLAVPARGTRRAASPPGGRSSRTISQRPCRLRCGRSGCPSRERAG